MQVVDEVRIFSCFHSELAPQSSSSQICLILCAVWSLREDQHSLVLAALCAAFPPRRRPGDWVVQADLAEGFLEAELT